MSLLKAQIEQTHSLAPAGRSITGSTALHIFRTGYTPNYKIIYYTEGLSLTQKQLQENPPKDRWDKNRYMEHEGIGYTK